MRGDFDVTPWVKPGRLAVLAVHVFPQSHPGVPHEHTVAAGVGKNGGETAIDGLTFLATIGWDWLAAVRDRDTGIWLPVSVSSSGPVLVKDPYVTSDLSAGHGVADLHVSATLANTSAKPQVGTLIGTISGQGAEVHFESLSL
jgi:beta-mannosidase